MNPMPRSDGLTGKRRRRRSGSEIHRDSSSSSQKKFRGVKQTGSGKWMARIQNKGSCRTIGSFNTAEEAAHAYDEEARKLWGERAFINFRMCNSPPAKGERFDFQCSELFFDMDELWLYPTRAKDDFASVEEVVESIK